MAEASNILADENGKLPTVTYKETLWVRLRHWLLMEAVPKPWNNG